MTKKKFTPFRIEDLTGGVNNRDYPSEIEDKQFQEMENWNFKGNRLVSGPGIDRLYNTPSLTTVRGLTVDTNDIWHIQDGNIYKNGSIEYENNVYNIPFNSPTAAVYSITIDGTAQIFNNANGLFATQLDAKLPADYIVTNLGGAPDIAEVKKTDGGEIAFTANTLVQVVSLDDTNNFSVTVDGNVYNVDMTGLTKWQGIQALEALIPTATYERVAVFTGSDNGRLQIGRKDVTAMTISGSANTTIQNNFNFDGLSWQYLDVSTITNLGIDITAEDRYNITVSNLGVLVIGDRINDAVFIDSSGTATSLPNTIGSPKVGTVYNGKIILGGYEGKDNIQFSQTEDPVAAGNELLNFSGYSAGAQSVSGGNKGELVGFIVGEEGLYAFKNNEIWRTTSEKDTGTSFNFIFKKVSSNGAASQQAICEVDQDIFYFDYINRAVRRLSYEENLTTLRDVSISREIEEVLRAIPDDDEGNNDRYSNLISMSYSYPYVELSFPDANSPYVFFNGPDLDERYRVPDNTWVYNVENKSWAPRTDRSETDKHPIYAEKGIFGTENGDIYKSIDGNTEKDGDSKSKLYTFGDDVRYDKYGRFDVVGRIIPDAGQTKSLTIEIYVDDELVDTRTISATGGVKEVREKIDMYDIGQGIHFRLKHSGLGRVEVFDVQIHQKKTTIQPQDFN